MPSRILVPLDGSARAEGALPVAGTIARASGATVLLLRVVDLSREFGIYGPVPAPALATAVQSLQNTAQLYLAEQARDGVFHDVPTETEVILGSAAHSILTLAASSHSDLIVLCSHGRSGLVRWALGSVAEHVARHTPVPTLILREPELALATRHPDPTHLLRVLVPLDGSRLAEAALEPAMLLAQALAPHRPAAIHLVTVLAPFEADPANMPIGLVVEGAQSYLERIARRLRASHGGPSVAWSVAVNLDTATALIHIAEHGDEAESAEGAVAFGASDFIAMATHGAGGLARWAIGSITDRVLHSTKLPMLVVRSPMSEA